MTTRVSLTLASLIAPVALSACAGAIAKVCNVEKSKL